MTIIAGNQATTNALRGVQGQDATGNNADPSDQIRKLLEQLMQLVPMLQQALRGQGGEQGCQDCGPKGASGAQGGGQEGGMSQQFDMLEELMRRLGQFGNPAIQNAIAGMNPNMQSMAQNAIVQGANLNSAGTVAGMPSGFA